jgi:ribosome biogenesis GTPase A
MHILNDFFLLVWQEDARVMFSTSHDIDGFLKTSLKSDYETFCDYASIILIINPQNIEKFSQLQESQNALKYLSGVQDFDKQRVQYLQKELLFFLKEKGDLILNKNIEKRFDVLRKEGIIGYGNARKLISLLALIQEKQVQTEEVVAEKIGEEESFYKNSIAKILLHVKNLSKLIESKTQQERIETIPQKIQKQTFSIGITGVMNAGKSTMLNALLGRDILGTSVVPETANLTILKYSEDKRARVNFWSKQEWNDIQKSSVSVKSIDFFIKETQEHFGTNIENFITEVGHSQEIKIEELASYTSAKSSNKLCNLVKSVELYSDLEFLKDGVSIVDTPGLDDPVIQREEITKTYLSSCDFMIHLMNVNQSATEKDVEFIVDTLLYQNVSRLLILITRIDTVKEEELKEVIDYTKTSIKNRLKNINKENKLDAILHKLDFIPVAGMMALLHRTGKSQEALKIGYTLEKSGILDVERYLEEVLFGKESEKVKIILQAAIKELGLVTQASKLLYENELSLFGKNKEEVKSELENYAIQIQQTEKSLKKLAKNVIEAKEELHQYFATLKSLAKNRILQLGSIVKRRVVDDVSYEMRKNKKRPQSSRIAYMIDSGIKDGFLDVVREYRYTFQKRVAEIFERLQRDFESFDTVEIQNTDAKEFFEKHFSDYAYVSNNIILTQGVDTLINSYAKKDIELMDSKIDELFASFFEGIYDKFDKKIALINENLLEEFFKALNLPIENVKSEMSEKQAILNGMKEKLEDESFDASQRMEDLKQKIERLSSIEKEFIALRKECE